MEKALLIGIDGASWNIIQRLKHTEVLSMRFIKSSAAWATLKSTLPPWSIPAWNSLFTGLSPERLGIHSFLKSKVVELQAMQNQFRISYKFNFNIEFLHARLRLSIPCFKYGVSQSIQSIWG